MDTTSLSRLDAVKTAVRKLEEAETGAAWMEARAEADNLRRSISDEMEDLLNSGMEDRGDLLAKYRALRKLHEMLAR